MSPGTLPGDMGLFRTGVKSRYSVRRGFTLIELLVTIGIIGVLLGILLPAISHARYQAKLVVCMNNLRQFAAADLMYANDYGNLPPMGLIPSSITVAQLGVISTYFNCTIPPGLPATWPTRDQQPSWINCPMAVDSGLVNGVTVGGGLYTGYAYYGGVEVSSMVQNGLATIVHPGHSANWRNTHRGVLWADILDSFVIDDPRRYECFHITPRHSGYTDFRYYADDVTGINRAWSDGSVEWVPGYQLDLVDTNSSDLQLIEILGNDYY